MTAKPLHIHRYLQPEGFYVKDDVRYGEYNSTDPRGQALHFIQSGLLKFCSCGDKEASLNFLLGVLRVVNTWACENPVPGEYKARELREIGFEGKALFIYYTLDVLGLTQHGSSVPGWLTPLGREILEDLEVLFAEESEAQ